MQLDSKYGISTNEIAEILSACWNRLRAGSVLLITQTNPAFEQNKNIKWSESPGISPVGEEKIYGGKDSPTSQNERLNKWEEMKVLIVKMKTATLVMKYLIAAQWLEFCVEHLISKFIFHCLHQIEASCVDPTMFRISGFCEEGKVDYMKHSFPSVLWDFSTNKWNITVKT